MSAVEQKEPIYRKRSGARNIAVGATIDREHYDALEDMARGLGVTRSTAISHLIDLHAGALLDAIAAQPVPIFDLQRWRDRKLTGELAGVIAGAVREGATKADAYRRAEVATKTGEQWEKRGRDDITAGRQSLYADLVAGLERARAELNAELIQEARRKGDYKTLLKLLDPEQFNPVSRQSVDVTHRFQLVIDWEVLSIEETKALAQLLRKASPLDDAPQISRTARPALEAIPQEVAELVDAEEGEWTEAPALEAPALEAPALDAQKPEH